MFMCYHKPSEKYVRIATYSSGDLVNEPCKGSMYARRHDADYAVSDGRWLRNLGHRPASEFEVHEVTVTVKRKD